MYILVNQITFFQQELLFKYVVANACFVLRSEFYCINFHSLYIEIRESKV